MNLCCDHRHRKPPATVLDVYLLAREMRAELWLSYGRWRIHLCGVTLREGWLERAPLFSGV